MNRILMLLTAAASALCVVTLPSAGDVFGQQATDTPHADHTWLHLSEVVARSENCRGGGGLLTFTTAGGHSHVHCLALPADAGHQTRSAADETKPLALLSAYVVRPDGKPDPRFGSQPRDIVILTSGDGRVIITFSDFSADVETGSYSYPAKVDSPASPVQ